MTLRRIPEDFVVIEELAPGVRGALSLNRTAPGAVAIYAIQKTSLTTPEATAQLAKSLGLKPGLVDHAGLKDKHAVTTQHVSVRHPSARALLPDHLSGSQWRAKFVGWTAAPLTAEAIAANSFQITIRGLDKADSAEMDRRAAALNSQPNAPGHTLTLINYFGEQRFGSARHGQGFAGLALAQGNFELALKLLIATPARKDTGTKRDFARKAATSWGDWPRLAKELPRCPERAAIEALAAGADMKSAFAALPMTTQQWAVEAYQSHIWNATARQLVTSLAPPTERLIAEGDFGDLLFPIGPSTQAASAAWGDLALPLFSETTQPAASWADAAAAVLAAEGLTMADLRVPGLRRPRFGEANRPLLVMASDFTLSPPEPDDLAPANSTKPLKRTASFTLPRGSYATVVLAALGEQ